MLIFRRYCLLQLRGACGLKRSVAAPTEPGVSHDLAVARAARVSDIRYRLSFTLKEHDSAVAGSETVTFDSRTAGDLPIDYRDGVIQSANLNGQPITKELDEWPSQPVSHRRPEHAHDRVRQQCGSRG